MAGSGGDPAFCHAAALVWRNATRAHHAATLTQPLMPLLSLVASLTRWRQVYKTKGADALLARWNAARLRLDRLQQQQREVARERARLREEVAAAIADADRRLAELEQQQPQQQEEEQGGIADAEEGAAGGSANGSGALNNASALQGALSGMTAASGQLPGEADDGDGGSAKPSPTRSRGTAWHARGCDWACGPPSAAAQEKRALKLKARAEKLAGQVHATEKKLEAVQAEFERCQLEAAEAKPAPCFFAAFHTAHAAAYAARLNLNPLHERMMRYAWLGGWVGG